MSNQLRDLIKEIQFKTDKTLEIIAKEIGYSRAYLTNQISKGRNDRLKAILSNKYELEIKQKVSDETNHSPVTASPANLYERLIAEKEARVKRAEAEADRYARLMEQYLSDLLISSKENREDLKTILRVNRADDSVIFDNQDEQLNHPKGSSATKAGKREIAAAQKQAGMGKQNAERK